MFAMLFQTFTGDVEKTGRPWRRTFPALTARIKLTALTERFLNVMWAVGQEHVCYAFSFHFVS